MKSFGMALAGAAAAASMSLTFGAAPAAAEVRQCGGTNGWGGVNAAGSASCGFALNVGRSLSPSFAGSSTSVTAYSPATGLTYSVNCWRKYQQVIQCEGGNAAVVYLVN